MTTALQAAQEALAAEHAAVYGYGVVGAWIGAERGGEASTAYAAHRRQRDALARMVRDLGGTPVAAQAAYTLPFEVTSGEDALRLAARLESRVARSYAGLVLAATGRDRRTAAEALRDAAVRAARFSGRVVAFPGLSEDDESGG